MSSWLTAPRMKNIPVQSLYCKTSTSGYGSNFFNFFMCYLYALSKKQKLYLKDTRNNISSGYHLILDTFEDLPGIQYTSQDGIVIQQLFPNEMNKYYESLSESFLKQEARRIFRIRSSLQTNINALKKHLPRMDYGIHIRTGDKITTGEMKAIDLQLYIDATKEFQKQSGKQSFTIYIMTDSVKALETFKKNADPSWQIYNLPSPIQSPNGHIQSNYNNQPMNLKMDAFIHFLTEIQIMKDCGSILCTFSSNIGRFIKLLTDSPIQSLD